MAFTATILSWRFRHLNIVGCLLKRRPTKGGSRAPQDPPSYAPVTSVCFYEYDNRLFACWRHFTHYQNPLNPGLHQGFYQLSYKIQQSIALSPYARESKTVLDSGFHALDSRIPKPIIPTFFHQNFKDSRFHKQKSFWDSGFGFPCRNGGSLGLQANQFTVFFLL